MYRTILVPFDGSALSATALPLAVDLARRTAATVHLAMVHDPSAYIPFVAGEVAVPIYDAALEREHREADARTLDQAVERLRAMDIPAIGAMLEGSIADALERYVERVDADLTVMTTHGRSGFQRLRLGSVATTFLTRITRPVLLLRAEHDAVVPAFPAGPIVCALDGSSFAEAMLPHARAFAEATGLPLHFVGVSVPHAVPMAPFGTDTLLVDDTALQAERGGRQEYLARLAANAPVGTTSAALDDMSVSSALLGEATRLHAGAIAIATHGRGGFARFMLGSTTDELIRHTHVPVLAYRPHAAGH
ncbi:MAG: universal stress protein [Gemmatimonadaceae bacterium]|nr:universal stress protein [Gemmatimonadaceae bacterium]